MNQDVFLQTWTETANQNAGLEAVNAAIQLMITCLKDLNGGDTLSGVRIYHDCHRRRVTISFVPIPMQPNRRFHYTLGKDRDAKRFIQQAPKIVSEHETREALRVSVRDAGNRCSDPTIPLLVHDEFFDLLDLCSNIKSRRIEIERLERAKAEAVKHLIETCSEKIGIPVDLVQVNSNLLLQACCRTYNKDLRIIGA